MTTFTSSISRFPFLARKRIISSLSAAPQTFFIHDFKPKIVVCSPKFCFPSVLLHKPITSSQTNFWGSKALNILENFDSLFNRTLVSSKCTWICMFHVQYTDKISMHSNYLGFQTFSDILVFELQSEIEISTYKVQFRTFLQVYSTSTFFIILDL